MRWHQEFQGFEFSFEERISPAGQARHDDRKEATNRARLEAELSKANAVLLGRNVDGSMPWPWLSRRAANCLAGDAGARRE